jgi:hypothetical protein
MDPLSPQTRGIHSAGGITSGAGKNPDNVAIKLAERHGHVLGGQRMQQRAEAVEVLIRLIHKITPGGAGIFTLHNANPQSVQCQLQAGTGRSLRAPRMSAMGRVRRLRLRMQATDAIDAE